MKTYMHFYFCMHLGHNSRICCSKKCLKSCWRKWSTHFLCSILFPMSWWFMKYLIRRECTYESCPVHTFLNCNNESCDTEWMVCDICVLLFSHLLRRNLGLRCRFIHFPVTILVFSSSHLSELLWPIPALHTQH